MPVEYPQRSKSASAWKAVSQFCLKSTSAVTGLELIRRIVGMANVKDITTIADEAKRARAEKICITAAIDFIKNRNDKKCGKCFLRTLKDAIAEIDA